MNKSLSITLLVLLALVGFGSFIFLKGKEYEVSVLGVIENRENAFQKKTTGLTMFRGNNTRTFYGTGPLPNTPSVLWNYPKKNPLCAYSTVGKETKQWCGSGWTGQPAVWERPDGITEIIVGAYDKKIHFINAETGEETRPPFETGDIIKGSVTLDPDGYPLLYSGSRDNFYRIIALDRTVPTELWKIEAKIEDGFWNNDWDGNAIIENDILYEGSENGIFHIIKLNRSYKNGSVNVSPVTLAEIPTFSEELIKNIGDKNVSIESSPAKKDDVVYIANSGGRVLGFDVSNVEKGIVEKVFDFWMGDDTDATLVIDEEGFLYAVSEDERGTKRSRDVGQIVKLDPRKKENPIVWSISAPKTKYLDGGGWATPALYGNYLYATTNSGKLLSIDKRTGTVKSSTDIGDHAWSSPIAIDETLVVGTCKGVLEAFSIKTPYQPEKLWSLQVGNGACIESTPAVWNGNFYFGTREGFIFKVGEKNS